MNAVVASIDPDRQDYETYLKRFRRIMRAVSDTDFKRVSYSDIQDMETHANWPSGEWFGATIPDFDGVLLIAPSPDRNRNQRDFYIQIDNILFLACRREHKADTPHFIDLYDELMTVEKMKKVAPYTTEELGYEIVEFLEDYRDWGLADEKWNKA